MKIKQFLQAFWQEQKGAIAAVAAVAAVPFLGFAAMALDVGYLMTVKAELQNAADAGALSGARGLIPYAGGNPPQPNWSNAETEANQKVTGNKAAGTALSSAQLEPGYWNLLTKEMKSTGITPATGEVPAIRVTVAKEQGQNGGPLQLFFAGLINNSPKDVAAQAVGLISGPANLPANSKVFPVAIAEELTKQHWNDSPPFNFKICSDYHYNDEMAGQWTSLLQDFNNVPAIRNLMDNGNPTPLKIGDNIYIQPGTKTSIYKEVIPKIGQIVIMPVVRTDFETHAFTPLLAFAPFKITNVVGGSGKYIEGYFVKDYVIPKGNPGGPYYGGFTPPRLSN